MEDYYKTLGVNSSATLEELRRAYRILARRYHPDVNPGKSSEERFKAISMAYNVLSDPDRRRSYDIDYEAFRKRSNDARIEAYRKQQHERFQARSRYFASRAQSQGPRNATKTQTSSTSTKSTPASPAAINLGQTWGKASAALRNLVVGKKHAKSTADQKQASSSSSASSAVASVSILEVSISMRDAIFGVRKTVEIVDPAGSRKVSVHIPPGTRTGSIVRMRGKTPPIEELVIIVRVAAHPFLQMLPKGLVAEVPISIQEAISGASITVPGIDETLVIKIPAGTQSGSEVRVREKGIADRDGKRGDIFYRMMIKVPEFTAAVGLTDKAAEIEQYYGSNVRQMLPNRLLEIER